VRLVPSVLNRFYHWIRHPSAHSLASYERTVRGFEHLQGYKYCLLVTYKRSGEGVPTPVRRSDRVASCRTSALPRVGYVLASPLVCSFAV
jgi:hypothetical protein